MPQSRYGLVTGAGRGIGPHYMTGQSPMIDGGLVMR